MGRVYYYYFVWVDFLAPVFRGFESESLDSLLCNTSWWRCLAEAVPLRSRSEDNAGCLSWEAEAAAVRAAGQLRAAG